MRVYKVKEVIKLLEETGWYLSYCKGDHRQFKHPQISGKVTVRGKLSESLEIVFVNKRGGNDHSIKIKAYGNYKSKYWMVR